VFIRPGDRQQGEMWLVVIRLFASRLTWIARTDSKAFDLFFIYLFTRSPHEEKIQ
jgi:hypothetical protein